MESRKRPHTDDGDLSVAKKRVLTSSNGTPHVNGVNDQSEDEQVFHVGLENFRKEAIYRRMKHYSRENERNLARIEDLERRKTTCEAGVAAMSACWSHLIETIRLLVNADSLSSDDIQANSIFSISEHLEEESIPQLKTAFGEASTATEALVTKLIRIGADKGPNLLRNETYVDCQKAKAECAALRSELQMTKKQLRECMESRDKYHNELQAAHNRVERAQSQTVLAVETRQPASKASSVTGDAEDTQRKPSSPSESPNPSASAPPPQVLDASPSAPEALYSRDQQIQAQQREIVQLKERVMELRRESERNPHSYYKQSDYNKAKADLDQAEQNGINLEDELYRVRSDNTLLRKSRAEWEISITAAMSQTVQEYKSMLAKRDIENTRLREQRDQQMAEISERKHKESVKLASLHELKNLSESRGERISILQAELKRCKARLSANEGREDLMLFFLNGDEDVAKQVETLKLQKEQVEIRIEALEHALLIYNQDHPDIVPHIKAQAEAEEKLAQVSAELAKFKNVFGDFSQLPPETSEMAARLQSQSTELERLRLLTSQQQQAEFSLYEELEKLSTAWESLDKQLGNKVFDLSVMEERLQKSLVEKAKSDNKYFSAMRDKEAIEASRKSTQRALNKSQLVVDGLSKVEKIVKDDREALRTNVSKLEGVRSTLEAELNKEKTNVIRSDSLYQQAQHRYQIMVDEYHKLTDEVISERQRLRAKEESLDQERKQLKQAQEEVQKSKVEAAHGVVHKHGHGSSDDGEYKHLRSLLLCSTCGSNFRSVIITKCMHTFCKPCVDARITTRQRKCPACNLQFGQADVSTLYMQ